MKQRFNGSGDVIGDTGDGVLWRAEFDVEAGRVDGGRV